MKVLVTGDWHINQSLGSEDRSAEALERVEEVVDIAIEEEVDLVLHTGDVWHRRTSQQKGSRLSEALFQRLDPLARLATPLVFLEGNHDPPEWIRMLRQFFYNASSYAPDGIPVHVVNRTALVSIPGLQVLGLPYPSKEIAAKQAGHAFEGDADSIAARNRAVSSQIGQEIQAIVQNAGFRKDVPTILAAHMTVEGALYPSMGDQKSGNEGYAFDWASDFVLQANSVSNQFVYGAFGHIHKPQRIETLPFPAGYPGALLRMSTAEADHMMGVDLVTIDGADVEVRHRPLTQTPMVTATITKDEFEEFSVPDPENTIVKLTIRHDGSLVTGNFYKRIKERFPRALDPSFDGPPPAIISLNERLSSAEKSETGEMEMDPSDYRGTTLDYVKERFGDREDFDAFRELAEVLVKQAEATFFDEDLEEPIGGPKHEENNLSHAEEGVPQ